MSFLTFYILSVVLMGALFALLTWTEVRSGESDLTLSALIGMIIVALIPCINTLMFVGMIIYLIAHNSGMIIIGARKPPK